MKTLVSFIGSGRRNEGESDTYKRTDYQYGDAIYSTAIFTEALIKVKAGQISECLLIGTQGSAWGSLIEKEAYEQDRHVELFDLLEDAFRQQNISDDLLGRLAVVLEEDWRIKVRCVVHSAEVKEESVLPILYQYMNALFTANNDFIVDVTHAFRSMPLILMSAVQVLEAARSRSVGLEIVYGEYSKQGPSPVRSLAPMWRGVEFARALRGFNERFDGEALAAFVQGEWASGAKAIQNLGSMLQANFTTQLDGCLAQVSNALYDLSRIEKPSDEVVLAAEVLREIHRRSPGRPQFYQRIFTLAELLKDRRLWGQAITTLQLCFEAFVFKYYGEDGYGDWDRTKVLCKDFGDMLRSRDRERLDKFHRLRNTRNAIAHGGARSKEGGVPQMQNLPSQYDAYAKYLHSLFCAYDK